MIKMLKEISEEPEVLRRIEKRNAETLNRLAGAVRDSGFTNVIFAGRGTSDHAGIYGQYLFQIFCGMSAGLATASAVTVYGAENCYKNSLVIALSQSGYAADALEVVKAAKKCGALTAAVTNDSESPLAKEADFSLDCCAGPEYSVAATKTFTAELAVMYLLAARISGREEKGGLLRAADSVEAMINDYDAEIKTAAEKYRNIGDGFVLSRGITYPIALETALKIQETCYIKMKGCAISDFYHGPLAQIEPETVTIVYAAGGKAESESLGMIDRLVSIGNRPLVVTDDTELKYKYENVLLLPGSGDEFLAPVVLATFAQLFAFHLCLACGGNPDSPRNLKKVTVTK